MRPDASHLRRQAIAPYVEALKAYATGDRLRLNVPGHKGGRASDNDLAAALGEGTFALDVPPLLERIDSGPSPTPFDQAQSLAAELWGAQRTWFLSNGASQGNHIAGLVAAQLGRVAIVQRNAHSSTFDTLLLSGLQPVFADPVFDRDLGVAHVLLAGDVRDALARHPDALAVLAASPTYFGAAADIAALVRAAHDHGVPLIVDEAWGSHFGMHPALPASALMQGADLVISSTHKMVGSLTQSAMLHLGDGPYADVLEPLVTRTLAVVESTSASSLLRASLDAARRLAAAHGPVLLEETLAAATALRRGIGELPGYVVADLAFTGRPGVAAADPLRIVIDVRGTGCDGHVVGRALRREHGIDLEVLTPRAVVAVLSMAEGANVGGERLLTALDAVRRDHGSTCATGAVALPPPWTPLRMLPREAFFGPTELISLADAPGRISADTLAAYPPGIPNVVAGEVFDAPGVEFLASVLRSGGFVRGGADSALAVVRVVRGIEDPMATTEPTP